MSRASMAAIPPVPAATRRNLFGVAGAMMLLTAAEAGTTKAAELDGELLACCAEAHRIDQASGRLADKAMELDEANPSQAAVLWDQSSADMPEFHRLVKRVAAINPRTPEGLRAKARLALSYTEEGGNAYDIALAVLRDVYGRAGA